MATANENAKPSSPGELIEEARGSAKVWGEEFGWIYTAGLLNRLADCIGALETERNDERSSSNAFADELHMEKAKAKRLEARVAELEAETQAVKEIAEDLVVLWPEDYDLDGTVYYTASGTRWYASHGTEVLGPFDNKALAVFALVDAKKKEEGGQG